MILTITMNPSVDIAYHLATLNNNTTNRVAETHKTPGGKGLNVTRVLAQLETPVVASGLIGGKIGESLEVSLDRSGIAHSFFKIEGETRNCIAILHDGQQTEILEEGPTVRPEEAASFMTFFESILAKADVITISGSLPKGLKNDYYVDMIEKCRKNNIPVVLDTSGDALVEVVRSASKPTAIKPNIEELSVILNREIPLEVRDLKKAVCNELFEGIEWIIVSLGSEGMFAKHNDKFYRVEIPEIAVISPVGSGDSTVAGIASAISDRETAENLLKRANTLGMLNAQEARTGYINVDNYEKLFKQINVVEV